MLDTSFLRRDHGVVVVPVDADLLDSILLAEDEMDAPADWDAGTITFDPWVI